MVTYYMAGFIPRTKLEIENRKSAGRYGLIMRPIMSRRVHSLRGPYFLDPILLTRRVVRGES